MFCAQRGLKTSTIVTCHTDLEPSSSSVEIHCSVSSEVPSAHGSSADTATQAASTTQSHHESQSSEKTDDSGDGSGKCCHFSTNSFYGRGRACTSVAEVVKRQVKRPARYDA